MKRKIILLCILSLIAVTGCAAREEDAAGVKVLHKAAKQKGSEAKEERGETLEHVTCPKFKGDDVRHVRVEEEGNILWEIDYLPQEDRASYLFWDIKAPYNSSAVVDTESMFRLYDRLASLDFSAETEITDIAAAGLLEPGRSIALDYYQGNQKTASDGTKPLPNKTFTLLIGKENGKGQYFCTLEGNEKSMFLLDQSTLDGIFHKNPYDLILKIPYVVDISTVSEVCIQAGDKKYTMKNQNGGFMLGEKKVEQKEYSEVYQALMQPMIAQELKAGQILDAGRQPVLSLEYIRTSDRSDNLEVCFYKYDEHYDSVSVNGNEFFLVNSREVEQLKKILGNSF